jgi:hypothetical protein
VLIADGHVYGLDVPVVHTVLIPPTNEV